MTATDPPSTEDVRQAAASVRAVLDAVDRGELEATGLETAHLAGAANALERTTGDGVVNP